MGYPWGAHYVSCFSDALRETIKARYGGYCLCLSHWVVDIVHAYPEEAVEAPHQFNCGFLSASQDTDGFVSGKCCLRTAPR
jgi:hypothetical protein